MNLYKPTWVGRLLVGLFVLLPAVAFLAVGIASADERWALIVGALLGAPGIWLWIGIGRMQLAIDERGVTRRGFFGGEIRVEFADVAEYRYRIYQVEGAEQLIITLHTRDGRKLKISSNWRDIYEAAHQLIDGVEAHLSQPSFGPITLEDDAIVYEGKRTPFADIDEAKQVGTVLRVSRKGKLLAAISLRTDKIPNLFLLLDELRARKVAAPEARPWRAVVSVAGYQVPKK